ncbi:MAG: transglycosylase SLT domain-containing protein [Rhodopila sp.]
MERVFAFQRRGDIQGAIKAASELEDPLLLGSVLADRYLGRYYKSTSAELSDWLVRYRDLPDAAAIHALLLIKLPKGAKPPPAPDVAALKHSNEPVSLPEDIDLPRNDFARDPSLDRTVLNHAQRGNMTAALRAISVRRGLAASYAAQLRAEVAQAAFIRNDDADALRIAQASLKDITPPNQVSLTWYIGGLAAWRLNQMDVARTMFEGGAQAAIALPHLRAASAFWASRVSRKLLDPIGMVKWLRTAAEERLTLHGLLARRILRLDTGILPSDQLLSQADVDAVAATPQGLRAFAFLQIDQTDRAEAELRTLWPQAEANRTFGQSLVMVASAAGLTDLAAQMAGLLQAGDGNRREETRVRLPRLQPAGGFRVDPSLVYALTRQESNFNPEAISPAGARGLMQIMPETAQYITGNFMLTADRLHEPAQNLAIGQRYVSYLAGLDGIDSDLIRILASYNCGPGSFTRWAQDIRDDGDPLLFIEAIPIPETRAFVPHVLLYSWLYAARLHRQAPSLDSLAAGEFPRFTPLERQSKMAMAANAGVH